MKRYIARIVAVGLIQCISVVARATPPSYTVTDLGTLGGTYSVAAAINNNGEIVGHSGLPGDTASHAFLYNGVMNDLGTLGGSGSEAIDINDSGVVAGGSDIAGDSEFHAILYDGTMHSLGTLGGDTSEGFGINNAGYVVGRSAITGYYPSHAFLYDGSIHDLGTLGGTYSQADAINDSGVVVGGSELAGSTASHAFLYNGMMHDLGTLGGNYSYAIDVNNSGLVVGSAALSGDAETHAFMYDGTMHDLGTLGGVWSEAYAINAGGVMVGLSSLTGAPDTHGVIWDETGIYDLNDLIPAESGIRVDWALDINDTGSIAAVGMIFATGEYHALLLTPATTNQPPVAVAGSNQSIHAGELVHLDGSGSYDDQTPSENLLYSWTFVSVPEGSTAEFNDPSAIAPDFVADLAGDYRIGLVVTDEQGLSSEMSEVLVSSLNTPPTADAGPDIGTFVGDTATLDGSSSFDPDTDPITYAWTIDSRPAGSTAELSDSTSKTPTITPDVEGTYGITLVVNDGYADSAPDSMSLVVISQEAYAEQRAMEAMNIVNDLPLGSVTTPGNQTALGKTLLNAIKNLSKGSIGIATTKLESALERADGCALRGTPDLPGGGGGMPYAQDYINNCTDQATVYTLIREALDAIGQ